MDSGLLLLRGVISLVLFIHAAQKLGGWFGGPGLKRATMFFEELGHRPGRQMVIMAGIAELIGAVFLLFGAVTPVGATIVTGVLLTAGLSTTAAKGTVWNAEGGGEYAMVLSGAAAVLLFTGPGTWSVDVLLGAPWVDIDEQAAVLVGSGTLLLAICASVAAVVRARAFAPRETI